MEIWGAVCTEQASAWKAAKDFGVCMMAKLCQTRYLYSPYSVWGMANPSKLFFVLTVKICFNL